MRLGPSWFCASEIPSRSAQRAADCAGLEATTAGEAAVQTLVQRATAAGVEIEIRQDAHTGDVAEEVVRVADQVDASVIVIGLRRRSPVGKLFLGSAAQRILLDADRPVLAVKP
ncbi:universal stress protein [Micromonospora sp. NPDC048930]|uniref:universal stress protein n=1 Tax=Micromonospora sp. NPDC048930 TaxID=3364261 RepID=UPI003724BCE9